MPIFRENDFSNAHFSISTSGDGFTILSTNGETILNGLEISIRDDGRPLKRINGKKLKWVRQSSSDSAHFVGNVQLESRNISISVTALNLSPYLSVAINQEYKKVTVVDHEAIVFKMRSSPSRTILPNGRLIDQPGLGDLWLGRTGSIEFSSGKQSFYLGRNQELTSLIYRSRERELWANLDQAKDHPSIRPDPLGTWSDSSQHTYQAGHVKKQIIKIYCGPRPDFLPQILSTTAGHLATFVWTEHACNCDFRTHRAVHFGSEFSSSTKDAQGGFAAHRIPVTKSVFFSNSQGTQITLEGPFNGKKMVSIKEDHGFEKLLKDLHESGGVEICLHGVQPTSSSRDEIEVALQYMKTNFDSTTWIDHVVLRHQEVRGIREGFLAFGTVEGKPHFMADLWKKYGVKYFWNHAPEYINRIPCDKIQRQTLLRRLYDRIKGRIHRTFRPAITANDILDWYALPNSEPKPLYWKNPSPMENSYSWTTRASEKDYFKKGDLHEKCDTLDQLVENWGAYIHHGYSCRSNAMNATWDVTPNGEIIVAREFDDYLKHMAMLRDRGDLQVSTIRAALDHWISLESIEIEFDSTIQAYNCVNHGSNKIVGLSMVVPSNIQSPLGAHSRAIDLQKKVIWFDLDPKQTIQISAIRPV